MRTRILIVVADNGFTIAHADSDDNIASDFEICSDIELLVNRVREIILKDLDQKSKGQ